MPLEESTVHTAHQQIRSATWQLHRQLDQLPLLKILTQPDCQLDDYRLFLQKMWRFHQYFQPRIVAGLGSYAPADLALRDKLAALDKDLQTLGSGIAGDAPVVFDRHCIGSEPAALGALYIIEGSTRGGQLLRKKMLERFSRDDIVHFFSVYGDHHQRLWQDFIRHLDKVLETDHDIQQASRGGKLPLQGTDQTVCRVTRFLPANCSSTIYCYSPSQQPPAQPSRRAIARQPAIRYLSRQAVYFRQKAVISRIHFMHKAV